MARDGGDLVVVVSSVGGIDGKWQRVKAIFMVIHDVQTKAMRACLWD
jgi:hypothetical protein